MQPEFIPQAGQYLSNGSDPSSYIYIYSLKRHLETWRPTPALWAERLLPSTSGRTSFAFRNVFCQALRAERLLLFALTILVLNGNVMDAALV